MIASIYENYGSQEVLQVKKAPMPVPKDNELLIRVRATTVNRTDCAMLRAKPFIMRFFTGLFKPKKPTLGTDFAGEIEAVGKDVKTFKVGDRVFGLDDNGLQSQAQYMTIAEDKAITLMPANLTFAKAAASMEGAHYAYNFLNKLSLAPGQKVLVNGATGAIGSAAVQFLVYQGIDVTAVCNTENLDLVKKLGASKVIDYNRVDFTLMGGEYDAIFDAVGKSSFGKCKPLLQPGGIYVSSELGEMIQNPLLALTTPLTGGKKVIFPIPYDCKRSLLFIKDRLEDNTFNPVIDRSYKLDHIAEAYKYVLRGEKIGNVVIDYDLEK
ncbi:MAG: NAD(P)-dependent alcohol dehydrogenase [Saprospiraceae bacterium]|nr:NAD(P)-dependent alcohol dehydrogenase [Saprospiraceae bacterium]